MILVAHLDSFACLPFLQMTVVASIFFQSYSYTEYYILKLKLSCILVAVKVEDDLINIHNRCRHDSPWIRLCLLLLFTEVQTVALPHQGCHQQVPLGDAKDVPRPHRAFMLHRMSPEESMEQTFADPFVIGSIPLTWTLGVGRDRSLCIRMHLFKVNQSFGMRIILWNPQLLAPFISISVCKKTPLSSTQKCSEGSQGLFYD